MRAVAALVAMLVLLATTSSFLCAVEGAVVAVGSGSAQACVEGPGDDLDGAKATVASAPCTGPVDCHFSTLAAAPAAYLPRFELGIGQSDAHYDVRFSSWCTAPLDPPPRAVRNRIAA